MDLLHWRSQLHFVRRIPENFLVCGTVVEPIPSAIDDRNHVGCVLGDDFKKLIAFGQFTTDPLELDLLIERVDVKQEHKACQPAYPLLEIKPLGTTSEVRVGEGQRDYARCQQ